MEGNTFFPYCSLFLGFLITLSFTLSIKFLNFHLYPQTSPNQTKVCHHIPYYFWSTLIWPKLNWTGKNKLFFLLSQTPSIQNTYDHQNVWGFLPTNNQYSAETARYASVEINSHTLYWELTSDPTAFGLGSSRLPSTSHANHKSQVVTCTSDQLTISWGFPWYHSLACIN